MTCLGLKCCGKSSLCNRNFLHDKRILEGEENALKEMLKEVTKEEMIKVKDQIRLGNWDQVAEELRKASAERKTQVKNQKLQVSFFNSVCTKVYNNKL